MGAKNWLGSIGITTLLAGCSLDSGPSTVPPGSPGYRPVVGERIGDGRVTQVVGDSCQTVMLSYEAEWTCSADQLAAIQVSSGPRPNSVPGEAPSVLPRVELIPTDCEGLAALRRPELKQAQQQKLDQGRASILANKCVGRTAIAYYSNGKAVPYCQQQYPTLGVGGTASSTGPNYAAPGSPPPTPTVSVDDSEASEYSTTNTQVVGVDEADFVKNDAGTVYVLSNAGLHVIDAWPAPETKEVKRVALPGEPRRLFLADDKLVVYTRLGVSTGSSNPSQQGCTYGYDCRFSAEPGQTMAIVFDVSEPSAPRELRRFAFSGNYVDSRRVGPYVYTVVQDEDSVSLPGLDLSLHATTAEELEAEYTERKRDADAAIDDAPATSFLPWIHRLDEAGNLQEDLDACDNALAAQAAQGRSFISLVAFDLDSLAAPNRTLIAGKPGYVYSSAEALYLATDGVDGGDRLYRQSGERDESTIHKFALDGVTTSYRGSVPVPGHVLNQFSMDEQAGVLRVATSSGWVPDPNVSSNLVTFSEQNGKFKQLGGLGGLAPSEDIRSVRFDGTRAFVVTFKKTDPLYVLDLAEPAAPKVLGELKIPGFSTYMHPLDQDHLLAIGFDADDHGDFAFFDGIQLQIFDVSDLARPALLHKTTIGTRGSASEALTNHLAFNYFPAKGVLAMPMTICDGGDDGMYGDKLSFSGLMVFDVSLEQGITERGRMPFVDPSGLGGAACGTWWASSTSDVKRSIFMDDYAIGISDTLYQVAPISELGQVLKSVRLGQ